MFIFKGFGYFIVKIRKNFLKIQNVFRLKLIIINKRVELNWVGLSVCKNKIK